MSHEPKILIGTPVYSGKDYCIERFIENIKKLDYHNYDFIVVDNSKSEDDWFFKKLQFILGEEHVFKVPRGGNSRQAICNAMNFIREYALKGGYEYLLTVESDLFPDPAAIKRLLSHKKKIIGSFYWLGFAEHTKRYVELKQKWKSGQISKQQYLTEAQFITPQTACLFITDKKNSGLNGTRILTPEESAMLLGTGVHQVHGVGLGCTLIRNDILRLFPFWFDNRFDNKHHDVYFYLDLQNNHIPVYVDATISVLHDPSDWKSVDDK